jgi:DNA-binding beta-propeller fold protein YncE
LIFGCELLKYRVVEGWGKHFYSPFVEVTGVAVDSKNNVHTFIRGVDPLLIFDEEGNFITCWGRGLFNWPHGLYVAPDDTIFCTDGDHTVKRFTQDGRLLMVLGKKGCPSDSGCVNKDYRTIKRGAEPFNLPTDVFVDKDGTIYVSDGYGNARVHKFSKEGELIISWGEPGRGPGQFNLPHGIYVHEGIVYVADRENCRIQLFDTEGKYLGEWYANRPTDVYVHDKYVYVTELGYNVGYSLISTTPRDGVKAARLTVFDLNGEIVARWGSDEGCRPGYFRAPHALCLDHKGNIYVGEVVISSAEFKNVPNECHAIQKFEKVK